MEKTVVELKKGQTIHFKANDTACSTYITNFSVEVMKVEFEQLYKDNYMLSQRVGECLIQVFFNEYEIK